MTKAEYIKSMYSILAPMCIEKGYGNVACGMIAQSIQEGWNSGLATKYFNYWGMKAGKSYKGKTVNMNNKAGNDPATYRAFTSMADGCKGYFDFLEYARYKPLKECETDAEYLDRIGPCGWNGNIGYGSRCKSHLKEVYTVLTTDDKPKNQYQWEVGKTYSTLQDLYIRDAVNGNKKAWEDITEDAQAHGMKDDWNKAILNRGTRITVLDIQESKTCIWLKIPSGWICGKNSRLTYVS